jgi:Ni/Co efflux regulator RcnB
MGHPERRLGEPWRSDLVVGNVLPSSYPGYRTVDNYSAYTLPAPPAGYEYVRVGNDVYMRQSTSGVIANIIGDLFR